MHLLHSTTAAELQEIEDGHWITKTVAGLKSEMPSPHSPVNPADAECPFG